MPKHISLLSIIPDGFASRTPENHKNLFFLLQSEAAAAKGYRKADS